MGNVIFTWHPPTPREEHVLQNKVNVFPHWPESCRCTPNRPAASRCSCIPCPGSWCCCSSVGSASSRYVSVYGTTEKGAHIQVRSAVTLTTLPLLGPTPGERQRVCGVAAVVHRWRLCVSADRPTYLPHSAFLKSLTSRDSATALSLPFTLSLSLSHWSG